MSAGISFSSRPRGEGDSPHVVVAGWWYQDDFAPLMDFIEALRSAKLFQRCIIVKTLSCEVTPKHNTCILIIIQTNSEDDSLLPMHCTYRINSKNVYQINASYPIPEVYSISLPWIAAYFEC